MIVTPDGVISSEAGKGESLLIDVVDPELPAIVKQEGAKGCIAGLQHVKWFDRQYPPYVGQTNRQPASVEDRRSEERVRKPAFAK